MNAKIKIPKLPQLLDRKIYKTGQTRGADDDVIFQNRVGRNSTVLIPYKFWDGSFCYPCDKRSFENGHIILISPNTYFENPGFLNDMKSKCLVLGENCVIFYETRQDWIKFNPEKMNWTPAESRITPLKGQYIARVPATTALKEGGKIIRGFSTSQGKGAGIRLYEYADSETIKKCRFQLECIFWLCHDSVDVASHNGMSKDDAIARKNYILEQCNNLGLLDYSKLHHSRILDKSNHTACPLCLEKLSGKGFFNKVAQADGREVPDLTVTEINLFHIEELKYGSYNHRPYNLSWGHHHCNIVTKDSGILETLKWMKSVMQKNKENGFDI